MKADLTQERLKELLNYDPATGIFTWLVSRGRTAKAGSVAGTINRDGYRVIRIDGRSYLAHRLAFLWMTGEFPPEDVDHRDGNPLNNAWENLRSCTCAENAQNRVAKPGSKSGLLGVHWHEQSGKWQSVIKVNGKTHYLGLFDTEIAAHLAYLAKKAELHRFNPVPRNPGQTPRQHPTPSPIAPRPGMTPPRAFAPYQLNLLEACHV